MNWLDWTAGLFTGMGIGSAFISWFNGKTIRNYQQIVADYEESMLELLAKMGGLQKEELRSKIDAAVVETKYDR